jgi:hypothetical protein
MIQQLALQQLAHQRLAVTLKGELPGHGGSPEEANTLHARNRSLPHRANRVVAAGRQVLVCIPWIRKSK